MRRQGVRDTIAAKKAERKAERDELAEGRMPETLAKWKVGTYMGQSRRAGKQFPGPLFIHNCWAPKLTFHAFAQYTACLDLILVTKGDMRVHAIMCLVSV